MKPFVIIALLLAVLTVNAQAPRKFYTRFGGAGYDAGYDVKQTLDNGYIIVGSTSSFGQGNTDMYLVKLDSMGNKKFETAFGNYNNEIGKSVVQLLDSSYVMVGYTNSVGFGGYDVFLVKADKYGALVWQKTIGGVDWDFAYSLQQTTDGGFIIGGTTYSYGRGNADGYVVKTDGSGNVVWSKTYGGANDDEFKSVIQTADGGYALTGYTKSYNDVITGDVWAFKLNNLGDSTWCKFYGGADEDFGNEIIEHPSGDYYIAGGTTSFGLSAMNGYALRLNSLGNYIHQMFDNTSTSYASFNSVAVSKRSSNFVCFIAKETFAGYDLQFKVLETDIYLNYVNGADYGSTYADETFKIIATNDKGYGMIGSTYGYGAINTDTYLVKLDSNLSGGTYAEVSVNEHMNPVVKLNMYPNPASKELNIVADLIFDLKHIKLFDMLGKEVYIQNKIRTGSDYSKILDVEGLTNGIYSIEVLGKREKISIIH